MTDAPDRLIAALADRYRIERELGAGGMATVYVAHDLKHDRDVALKVLRPELAAVIGAERFLAEIKTTAALQHPHILALFDSGQADGFLFYVMPLIEGESLRDRLVREHQLAVDDAVRLAKEIASALDYAHRHGVIHRDIKPENILLHDGSALVADFGIALAVSHAGGNRMTETGLSLGTPGYMSPEQATGERTINARSDVYSLGCLLYENARRHAAAHRRHNAGGDRGRRDQGADAARRASQDRSAPRGSGRAQGARETRPPTASRPPSNSRRRCRSRPPARSLRRSSASFPRRRPHRAGSSRRSAPEPRCSPCSPPGDGSARRRRRGSIATDSSSGRTTGCNRPPRVRAADVSRSRLMDRSSLTRASATATACSSSSCGRTRTRRRSTAPAVGRIPSSLPTGASSASS